jgi:predicted Holliday junction resolvase-like endonuclease
LELFLLALLTIETIAFVVIFYQFKRYHFEQLALLKLQADEDAAAFQENFLRTEKQKIRKETLKKSERVARGFTVENFAPYLQEKYSPTDFRHLGDPVDYVIYDGLTDVHQGVADEIKGVVLLDIKTGQSRLNKVQRRIRDAVNSGKVSFKVYNPDKGEL